MTVCCSWEPEHHWPSLKDVTVDILLRGFLKMMNIRKLQEGSPDHPVNHDGDSDHKSETGDDQDCKDVVLDFLK